MSAVLGYFGAEFWGVRASGVSPPPPPPAPTGVGQTDALALAVVAWLTANASSFALQINPQRRFHLLGELSKIAPYGQPVNVDVFPDAEACERQGASTAFKSVYAIHLFIQQQISGAPDEDAQCQALTELRSQIIEALKLRMFDLTGAVHPVGRVFLSHVKSADRGLYDLQRLMQDHVYASDTLLTFRASV